MCGWLLKQSIEGLCSPLLDCVTKSCLIVATITADNKQDGMSCLSLLASSALQTLTKKCGYPIKSFSAACNSGNKPLVNMTIPFYCAEAIQCSLVFMCMYCMHMYVTLFASEFCSHSVCI